MGYLLNPASSKYDMEELAASFAPSLTVPDQKAGVQEQASWQAMAMERISNEMLQTIHDKGLDKLYFDMELPLVEVLADMEGNGIYVNRRKLLDQSVSVGRTIADLEAEIHELAGRDFNINSPKQLGEVLFEGLGLPVIKKTKTGYSTNAEVLNQLRGEHPIIEKILRYRLWNKLKTTYLDGINQLIDGGTARVHTTFNQTVTATGRLSSSDPNLQNIPVRTEEGKQIRQLFEPGEGYDYLLSADYSQIELRVLAHMSQDENFIQAFSRNEDIHARTAAEVFGIPIEEVTPTQRRNAKAVNFGIVYGMSDYGLSQDLGITRKEAAGYIDSYFEKCKGVKAFIDKVVEEAHAKGYVQTAFGRRRELPSINSSNYTQRMLAERMAMNTPIQGTAADIIKLAMIKAHTMLKEAHLKSRILLQVHDELVLEVTEPEIPQVKAILKEAMEHIAELSVPLSIDINMGKNWAEAK
jgi:DNA polymerase-1